MIIWFIGISGAGKTTLGTLLRDKFVSSEKQVLLIDGDSVRSFFENDLGYSKKDRKENIKRIIFASHISQNNGCITIVCNMSPFEELRAFCRQKLNGYIEIYLDKKFLVAKKNDVKGVYNDPELKNIVGHDIVFEKPVSSDLRIPVDDFTIDQSLEKIVSFLKNEKKFDL